MLKELKEKIVEALVSALPITAIVYVLALTPFFDFSPAELITFTVGAVFLILGIGLFNLGADLAMTPMGTHVGSGLSRKEKAQALREVFNNRTLLGTITPEVLALDIPPSRVFWKLFAKRHYRLCFLLLWYKAHR